MKKVSTTLLLFSFMLIQAQQSTPQQYLDLTAKADSLYLAGDYKNSALTFSTAFAQYSNSVRWTDRWNAACSWALTGNADSAIANLQEVPHLYELANKEVWQGVQLLTDPDLEGLHSDKRMQELLTKAKEARHKAIPNINKEVTEQLEEIYVSDQKYRYKISGVEKMYGRKSKQMTLLWDTIGFYDSVNLLKVKVILDKHGWLGKSVVGDMGNTTLFLVIQHADLATQEKYLPIMREAVKNGNAKGNSLALLEDRVALRNGRKQIYGSQIGMNDSTGAYYISPMEDPDNVDKRRESVGLGPLANYAMNWQIKWDVEQYKKDLPAIEAYEKTRKWD